MNAFTNRFVAVLTGMAFAASNALAEPGDADPTLDPPAEKRLRVASWGGAYGQAQELAIVTQARKRLGVKIERVERTGDASTGLSADVVEVNQSTLVDGCASGAFAKIQPIDLVPGPDGDTGNSDFVSGGLSPCGVASFAWSSLILFDTTKFKKRKPGRLADVFNIKRFPGKRAFQRSPDGLLEMFLMANGTPRDQVYEKLSDRKQRDDTFKALEALLPHIVFVDSAGEALEELESGAVVFSIGYSGRAFRKTIAGNIRAIWDGHVYDHGSWAISSNANDRSLAKDFISLATSPQLMAAQARLWPYGPMRKSAAALVGRHARLDIELAPFMPTSEIRLNAGLRRDATFWAENRERLEDRLAALREGFPLGVRVPPPPRKPAPEPVTDDSQE